eukprot:m.131215 g.131215  ORF g.131215 m.131215 type:complete len:373 (+) comp52365_c0_seq3:1238-2356(+)
MAQFRHEHVTALIGVVTLGDPVMVVMEYCEFGSLEKYVRDRQLDQRQRFGLAADAAAGLAYLASLLFVHRDIAARNILVNSEQRAKISDFGLSRDTSTSAYYHSQGGQLPVRWTAPEALETLHFTSQSDCWSFGILLFEIWTNAATPYAELDSNQKVWVAVTGGYRLPMPEGCPPPLYSLMQECWSPAPMARPSFPKLVGHLRQWELESALPSQTVTAVSSTDNDGYMPLVRTHTAPRARGFVEMNNARGLVYQQPVRGSKKLYTPVDAEEQWVLDSLPDTHDALAFDSQSQVPVVISNRCGSFVEPSRSSVDISSSQGEGMNGRQRAQSGGHTLPPAEAHAVLVQPHLHSAHPPAILELVSESDPNAEADC